MSLDNVSTLVGIFISIGGVIGSFLAMANEQRKNNEHQKAVEKRIEYKLRIYEMLLADTLSFEKIAAKFNASSPLDLVDQIELRKCLYEMLVEDNIVSFNNGKYTSNTMDLYVDGDDE
jgi:hypothetical protein